ncbi:MAG: hypothetical protein DRN91_01605 [Candidatus Alkanophagales archaeon]|nr:MAG: hypothetical protein DRN91_01605 [Candidatus Alkanophagales archaeon]
MVGDLLEENLHDAITRVKADYVEIRLQKQEVFSLKFYNGQVQDIRAYKDDKIGLRALKNGSWLIFHSNEEKVFDLVERARRSVAKLPHGDARLAFVGGYKGRYEVRKKDVDFERKLEFFRQLESSVAEDVLVWGVPIRYAEVVESKHVITSEGVDVLQRIPYVLLSVSVNTALASHSRLFGGVGGFANLDAEKILEEIKEMSKVAVAQLTAKPISGKFKAVFSPSAVGSIAEKVAHLLEADFVRDGLSAFRTAFERGERVAPAFFSLSDAPLENSFCFFKYDDEGVTARKKELIKEGVPKELIHNRETAVSFGTTPNGGGRGPAGAIPLPRAGTAFVNRGDASFDEIMDMKHGIYIDNIADSNVSVKDGNFKMLAQACYLVEDGELKKPLRTVSLVGNVLELLRNVEVVGDDFALANITFDEKAGQVVPVCSGGPHVRVAGVRIV